MKPTQFFAKAVILTFITIFWITPVCKAQTQVKQFWGMTQAGGSDKLGTIFSTDSSGNNLSVQYSFSLQNEGAIPPYTQLTEASDGKLYGITQVGGANSMGVLFQYDPITSTYIKKLDFIGSTNGANPYGSLIRASDGKLYGMTYNGGTNNMGVLFQYNPITSTCTKKLDFSGSTNGANPAGSLIQASDGKLYGMTYNGGSNSMGVLFQYDFITSTYTKILDFIGATNGANPYGALMQASDGNLYGMTKNGGVNSLGVLFQYNPMSSFFNVKVNFAGTINGQNPTGSLIQGSDGKLYGMTYYGGTNNRGVLFQYDPAMSIYTKKLDFAGTINGQNPAGSLMPASDGKLYGMTSFGGTNNKGVLFQYDPATSIYAKKIDFAVIINGSSPYGSLMQASDGKLYGMTSTGGTNGKGVLFQFDFSTSSFIKKLDFEDISKGATPIGSLMLASNGKLYGLTSIGGVNNMGVLFQFDPTSSLFEVKVYFDGVVNGSHPYGTLIQLNDGTLYGTTSQGGANDKGVLFQYDPASSIYTKKLDFDGVANGTFPSGTLIQASNGQLYGMTGLGGTNDFGVIFKYDPVTSICTKIIDFNGGANGQAPYTNHLMQANDGKLYGMTYYGGNNSMGVLFQYDPISSSYTKKLDFDGINGGNPSGSLIQAIDGKLYGMTYNGGAGGINNKGVLFQYDPITSAYTKKLDFFGAINGANPAGTLMQASDGKLYGMTGTGGVYDKGVLLQYDPITSIYTKKFDFSGINGDYSTSNLIEITVNTVGTNALEKELALKLYPNPVHDLLTLELLAGNQKSATIIIENMFGQVIYETQMNTSIHQIHTEHYDRGVYFVKVKTNDGVITKKVIVE